MADDLREHPFFETVTESKNFLQEKADEIANFLARKKGPNNEVLEINVVTVLGAGWDQEWEGAFGETKGKFGFVVDLNVTTFDNNLNQIREF